MTTLKFPNTSRDEKFSLWHSSEGSLVGKLCRYCVVKVNAVRRLNLTRTDRPFSGRRVVLWLVLRTFCCVVGRVA